MRRRISAGGSSAVATFAERRAQRAGVPAQEYARQLLHANVTDSVLVEVRRAKALAVLLRAVTITDSDGKRLTLEDLHNRHGNHDRRGD